MKIHKVDNLDAAPFRCVVSFRHCPQSLGIDRCSSVFLLSITSIQFSLNLGLNVSRSILYFESSGMVKALQALFVEGPGLYFSIATTGKIF